MIWNKTFVGESLISNTFLTVKFIKIGNNKSPIHFTQFPLSLGEGVMGGYSHQFPDFTWSCASTLFSPHSVLYPSLPPDPMSFSVLLFLSHHPPHTTYFSSLSHHHLVQSTSNHSSEQLRLPVQSPFSLSALQLISYRSDTQHIHRSVLASVSSNCPICSASCTPHTF